MKRRKTNRRRVPIRVRFGAVSQFLKEQGRRCVPYVLAGAILLVVPYLAFFAYRHVVSTEYFALQTITVDGNARVSSEAFLRHVGVVEGMNVFDIDAERVESAGEMMPWIADVAVEVKLPHTLHVTVKERTPALVAQIEMQNWYADATGELIETGAPILGDLPYLTGLDLCEVTDRPRLIVDAIAISDAVGAHQLTMSEVHFDTVLGFSVMLMSGTEIRIGHDQFGERLRRAKIVLDGRKDAVAYILVDHALSANRVIVGREQANYHGR